MAQMTVTIDDEECAIIIRGDGETLAVRIEAAAEPENGEDGESQTSMAKMLAVAVATRFAEDKGFAEEMLEWFENFSNEPLTE